MSNLLEYLQAHEDAFKSRNRLASLYSSFHTQRANNPEGYAANSSAWLSALTKLSRAGLLPPPKDASTAATTSALSFSSGASLSQALTSAHFGQPLALGSVVNDAVEKGDLIPLQAFLASEKSIYHKPWVKLPTPVQVITWGLSALGLTSTPGTSDKLLQGSYVVRANVEAAASSIITKLSSRRTSLTESIVPRSEFEKDFAAALGADDAEKLSSTDFKVLLRYLSRDRSLLSYSASTVKIAQPDQAPQPVTAQDESIANLRALISSFHAQTTALQQQISVRDKEARLAVADKQNTKAKLALRQKKAAEGLLEQRSKTLETLEQTWRSIEAAADNVAIVKAMKDSGEVLKAMNAAVGGAEGVDQVVEQLQEQMDATQDITTAVTEGGRTEQIDEGDVEDELQALEEAAKEQARKVEAEEKARREQAEKIERERMEREEEAKTKARLAGLHTPIGVPGKPAENERRPETTTEEAA